MASVHTENPRLSHVPDCGVRTSMSLFQTIQTMIADMLLQVDRMYRERAAAGELRKIAPRRFNPTGEAWLPILHARHGDWHFTALFSNTQLAHQLDKTSDWVVIFYHKDGQPDGRCTVVTATRGPSLGRRVIRGREGIEDEKELPD